LQGYGEQEGLANHVPAQDPGTEPVTEGTWVTGIVVDAWDGMPLVGVRLVASGAEGRTGDLGRFGIVLHGPAEVDVQFLATGYRPALKHVTIIGQKGELLNLGSVTLQGQAAFLVKVLDHQDRPVEGAFCWPLDSSSLSSQAGNNRLSKLPKLGQAPANASVTSREGRADLGLFSGLRVVSVAIQRRGEDPFVMGPLPLDGTEVVLRLPRLPRLTVVAPSTADLSAPLFETELIPLSGPLHARFRRTLPLTARVVSVFLPPGTYHANLRLQGQIVLQREIDLRADQELQWPDVEVAGLSLRVHWEDGPPVSAFRFRIVQASEADDMPESSVFMLFRAGALHGRDGHALAAVRAGESPQLHHVLVGADGGVVSAMKVWVGGPNALEQVDVVLRRAAIVRGVIRGLPQGTEVRLCLREHAASKSAWTDDAPMVASAVVSQDGTYELTSCGAGTYEIKVATATHEASVARLEVPDSGLVTREDDIGLGSIRIRARTSGHPPDTIAPVLSSREDRELLGPDIPGTRRDRVVTFPHLLPGIYVAGWSMDLQGLRTGRRQIPAEMEVGLIRPTQRIEVRPASECEIFWEGESAPEVRHVRFVLPEGLMGQQLVAGLVPIDGRLRAASEVRWQVLSANGGVSLVTPRSSACLLVVSSIEAFSGGPSSGMTPVFIHRYEEGGSVPELLNLPNPGGLRVMKRDTRVSSVGITPAEFEGILRWSRENLVVGDVAPLAPGEYIVLVTGTDPATEGRVLRRTDTVLVRPGMMGVFEAAW
jgi:hypothetical protein